MNSPKPNIVITGASGLLGHPLCIFAKQTWTVHALFRQNQPIVPGIETIALDLLNEQEWIDFITKLKPKAVIHAAANASVPTCNRHPEQTARINVHVPGRMAQLCAELNINFIFISTDLVFNGLSATYNEKDIPCPVDKYGEQKLRAEKMVLQSHPKAVVCRMPLLFGIAPYSEGNFMVKMLDAIRTGKSLNLFIDEYRTPVDHYSAAKGILRVLGRTRGILHMGGRSRMSRYDMGLMMAKAMRIKPDMIHPVRIEEVKLAFKRAPDCSLDSRWAFALGYDPAPVEPAMVQVVERYFHNHPI
ncbi:MAG: SDR family oxidoreductase [Desulfobacteraceae bacterium]|jgi:dTDP-4-dehydrorhamnose reductase